jgi:chromosome segregation ATPase
LLASPIKVVQGLQEELAKVRQEEEGKEGELSNLQFLQQELTSTITAKEEQLRELQQQLQEVSRSKCHLVSAPFSGSARFQPKTVIGHSF